jgi:hypothetical protein
MAAKISRILSACVLLALLANARPSVCEAWSLLHPFSSETDTKLQGPAARPTKKEPSTLDKVGAGTKNFFSKTGETLGLKKAQPKKPLYVSATPKQPVINQPKKNNSKSWFPWMKSEEPPRPKNVPEWMENRRLDLP